MSNRKLISLFCILLFFVGVLYPTQSQAEVIENDREDRQGPDVKITEKKFGPYKDEKRYYEDIDSITYAEIKELESDAEDDDGFTLNPVTWASNFVSDKADDVTNSIQDSILAMLMSYLQLGFGLNVAFTEWMLTVLNFSNDAVIINWMVDGVSGTIQNISGVESNSVKNSGIFGKLLGLFALVTTCYVAYQALIKRAPIESLKAMVQPILALALSIALLSNFATYIKGMNDLGNELSTHIINLTITDEKTEYNTMEDKIWKIFVHRPYMYLQFGTDNENEISDERIENILLKNRDNHDKKEAIKKEVTEYENDMMQPSSVIKRLVYQIMFAGTNGLLSIPVWLLSGMLIGLQIWFVVVACFAPFVLVWTVLPGQFGVLKRYGEALFYPLIFKLIVSFIAMILFTISDIVYSLPSTKGLAGYIIATFLQFVIFITAFVFRKRINKIFEQGSPVATHHIRESWNLGKSQVTKPYEQIEKPLKKTMRGTSMLVGQGFGLLVNSFKGTQMKEVSKNDSTLKQVDLPENQKSMSDKFNTSGQSSKSKQSNAFSSSSAKTKNDKNKKQENSNQHTEQSDAEKQTKHHEENTTVSSADSPLVDMEAFKQQEQTESESDSNAVDHGKLTGTNDQPELKDIDEFRKQHRKLEKEVKSDVVTGRSPQPKEYAINNPRIRDKGGYLELVDIDDYRTQYKSDSRLNIDSNTNKKQFGTNINSSPEPPEPMRDLEYESSNTRGQKTQRKESQSQTQPKEMSNKTNLNNDGHPMNRNLNMDVEPMQDIKNSEGGRNGEE